MNIPTNIDSRRSQLNAETDNRRDILRLQTQFNVSFVRAQLESFLWHGKTRPTGRQRGDARKNEVPSWFFMCFRGLNRMFEVTEDETLRWAKFPERFDNGWRQTTRKELEHYLATKTHGVMSRYQVTTFLRKMEDHGIITRDHCYDPETSTKQMYIRFRADRVLSILTFALKQLSKADCRVNLMVKSDEIRTDFIDNAVQIVRPSSTSNLRYQPSYQPGHAELHTDVGSKVATVQGCKVVPGLKEKKDYPPETTFPGAKSFLPPEPDSVRVQRVYRGSDAILVKVTPEMELIVKWLAQRFGAQFVTPKVVKQARRLTRLARKQTRLTYERLCEYARYVAAVEPTDPIADYDDVVVFLKFWPSILKNMRAGSWDSARDKYNTVIEVENFLQESTLRSLLDLRADRMWHQCYQTGMDMKMFWTITQPGPEEERPELYECVRFVVAEKLGILQAVRLAHGQRVRKLMVQDPILLVTLTKLLPKLREWIQLSNQAWLRAQERAAKQMELMMTTKKAFEAGLLVSV